LAEKILQILPANVEREVRDVELSPTATGTTTIASEATTTGATKVSTGRATREARFRLAVLADVNEAVHEILVAERVDSILRLLPCCVFHNPASLQ
jgi:hypothetical protein